MARSIARTALRGAALGLAAGPGVFAAGCSAGASTAPRPAAISHIVFVTLADEGDTSELLADSDAMLGTIPSVASYAAGPHLDTGRATVDDAYSLGIYLGFRTEADLAEYVAHPQHVAYVQKWRPRLESLLVRDVIDESP